MTTTAERLRAHFAAQAKVDPAVEALVTEACRIVERLDDMDQIISGKGVLELLRFRLRDNEGRVAEVKFDAILSEARQQAGALGTVLSRLGAGKADKSGKAEGGDPIDELARRRADRGAGPAEDPGRARRSR